MMQWMLIGHRGVGKSQFLRLMQNAVRAPGMLYFSLDEEIEKRTGQSIKEIFANHGESWFRRYEKKIFSDLVTENKGKPLVVDVGAGFTGEKPMGWKALWLRRATDPKNYQFLDRPQLDGDLGLSDQRFDERQERYSRWADTSLEIVEGDFHSTDFQMQWTESLVQGKPLESIKQPWMLTLLNENHLNFHNQGNILSQISFELRDDLLSRELIKSFISKNPESLLSLRQRDKPFPSWIGEGVLWDRPLEWGLQQESPILSLHERQDDFIETLKKLPETDQIIKLACPIKNFSELREGHLWQQEEPSKRVFLPSSDRGRWSWYRLLTASMMPFSFLREGQGSSIDQPTLNEVFLFNPEFKDFAAILGSPVSHSLTPSFHHQYFKKKKANVLRVNLKESEFTIGMPLLKKLGLKYAAVTSPLKIQAARSYSNNELSVNTLFIDKDNIKSSNTDIQGFQTLSKQGLISSVAVWGGGGTLDAISAQFPGASFYSSRTGELKKGGASESPEMIVWAVGRDSFSHQGVFPPDHWRPKVVLDLNYTQDSPGIECAHKFSCQYHSGLTMFIEQAQGQQEFWNECQLK